ncbi:MAG TPA: gluconate 2-dehydrogenase subunit 3 family protein [Puia sp.]
MDRRKSLKTLLVGGLSVGAVAEACNQPEKEKIMSKEEPVSADNKVRMPEEIIHDKKIAGEVFFTAAEMAVITVLVDIIIPKDDMSGSATDVKVPEFIAFIVNDKPDELQVPLRGGIRWLELESLKRFDKSFTNLSNAQQLQIVDDIAYPEKKKSEFSQGVTFFTLMRNLTVTGFYTTEAGFKDIGYVGNRPNQWNGVPDDVLKHYNMAYTEKELKECISFDKA